MNWLRNHAFGSRAGGWFALAIVMLVSFALCIASLRLVFWFLTRKRDTDEGRGSIGGYMEEKTQPYRMETNAGFDLDVETENEGTEIEITAQGKWNILSGASSTRIILYRCL